MRAAAESLVPVTLELSRKYPVIVDRDSDLALAEKRVALGKTQNSGQLCISPYILFVPAVFETSYPAIADIPDYTRMIDQRV